MSLPHTRREGTRTPASRRGPSRTCYGSAEHDPSEYAGSGAQEVVLMSTSTTLTTTRRQPAGDTHRVGAPSPYEKACALRWGLRRRECRPSRICSDTEAGVRSSARPSGAAGANVPLLPSTPPLVAGLNTRITLACYVRTGVQGYSLSKNLRQRRSPFYFLTVRHQAPLDRLRLS